MNILFHIVAGLILGYAIASFLESYLHRAIHQAGPAPRNKIISKAHIIEVLKQFIMNRQHGAHVARE